MFSGILKIQKHLFHEIHLPHWAINKRCASSLVQVSTLKIRTIQLKQVFWSLRIHITPTWRIIWLIYWAEFMSNRPNLWPPKKVITPCIIIRRGQNWVTRILYTVLQQYLNCRVCGMLKSWGYDYEFWVCTAWKGHCHGIFHDTNKTGKFETSFW